MQKTSQRRWPGLLVVVVASLASMATSPPIQKDPLVKRDFRDSRSVTFEYPADAESAVYYGTIRLTNALGQGESPSEPGALQVTFEFTTPADAGSTELRATLATLEPGSVAPLCEADGGNCDRVLSSDETWAGAGGNTLATTFDLSKCDNSYCELPFMLRVSERSGSEGTLTVHAIIEASVTVQSMGSATLYLYDGL